MLLIEALKNPSAYPHPTSEIEIIETQVSWVVLTGEIAYKLKKPVDFGFLNFTTLELRKKFCEEEIRLNQRLSPDIYQQVVAIGGPADNPTVGSDSDIIEYAVQMKQFASGFRLDTLLQQHRFESSWIDALAKTIADFHSSIPMVANDSPWGEPEAIWQLASDNFTLIPQLVPDDPSLPEVARLEAISATAFENLKDFMRQRKSQGFVRECHGDLYLANITLHEQELRVFDCIEFNLEFRWLDCINDLSFLLMDLEANGQFSWANRCLNQYLEHSGDYDGVRLLNFYKSFRSMVRAKVSMLGGLDDYDAYQHYLKLTARYNRPAEPALYLMHGVSGSGKSHLSEQLTAPLEAIRIRSDVERKRLFREAGNRGERIELYGADMNLRTYHRLFDTSQRLLQSGHSVIVDATFIRQCTRQNYIEMAEKLGVPVYIISCHCEQRLLEARLKRRQELAADPSDADVDVMLQQQLSQHPLSDEERQITLFIDTDDDEAAHRMVAQLSGEHQRNTEQ